jgi:hypothetical protein
MSMRLVMMLSAVVLTLILPAGLASWIPSLRKSLSWLVIGLLVQIAGEFALMGMNLKHWIPYFEMPFVGVRIVQVALILFYARELQGSSKMAVRVGMLLNRALLCVGGSRLVSFMLP